MTEVIIMKKILLTGFEGFLTYETNPSEEIVNSLNGRTINNYQVIGKVLPVSFSEAGDLILNYIKSYQPSIVVSLGIAAKRSKVTPERIAININEGAKDNRGYQPKGEKIIENAPDGLFSTLPIKDIVEELHRNKLPAEISNTAGTYLCNHVMYQSLHYIRKKDLSIKSGFIHLPLSHELAIETKTSPSWSLEDLKKAVEISLSSL